MLTAKAETHDIVAGMGARADDFLGKPFHRDELQVRLRAGMRITKLNRELIETNRRMSRVIAAAAETRQCFASKSLDWGRGAVMSRPRIGPLNALRGEWRRMLKRSGSRSS